MEAQKIDYTPGPAGDPGSLMAVGPGWLRVRSEQSPPAQARWQQWLRMRPDGEGHVVSIAGDADVAIEKFEMEREHVVQAWKQWMEA